MYNTDWCAHVNALVILLSLHSQLKQAGTMCRSAAGSCDLPEYCTGGSPYCPSNVYLLDGSSCQYSHAYCYNGMCLTHEQQCLQLWGYGENTYFIQRQQDGFSVLSKPLGLDQATDENRQAHSAPLLTLGACHIYFNMTWPWNNTLSVYTCHTLPWLEIINNPVE